DFVFRIARGGSGPKLARTIQHPKSKIESPVCLQLEQDLVDGVGGLFERQHAGARSLMPPAAVARHQVTDGGLARSVEDAVADGRDDAVVGRTPMGAQR